MNLTDEELVILDGKCRPEIQKEVDGAKRRLSMISALSNVPPKIASLVADAVHKAKISGELKLLFTDLRYCNICEKSGGYAKVKRTHGFKKKGDPDHSKPLYLRGVDLNAGFIRIKGVVSIGCCANCWNEVRPILASELCDVRAEISESITGIKPKFKKYRKQKCTVCGWEGHEGQMRQFPVLMGGGSYPGGCPKCDAGNHPFGSIKIVNVDGFEIVEVTP